MEVIFIISPISKVKYYLHLLNFKDQLRCNNHLEYFSRSGNRKTSVLAPRISPTRSQWLPNLFFLLKGLVLMEVSFVQSNHAGFSSNEGVLSRILICTSAILSKTEYFYA